MRVGYVFSPSNAHTIVAHGCKKTDARKTLYTNRNAFQKRNPHTSSEHFDVKQSPRNFQFTAEGKGNVRPGLLKWIRPINKRQLHSGSAEACSKNCLDHFLCFRGAFQ